MIWFVLSSMPVSTVCASNFFGELDLPEEIEITLPSMLTLELGTDAIGSRDTFVNANFSLHSGNRLKLGIGNTSYDDLIDDSTTYLLGFTGNPLDELSFGFNYTYLKSSFVRFQMKKDSLLAFVTWQQKDWSISFQPQISDILLQSSLLNETRDIRSPGLGVSAAYFGFSNISLYASHTEYSYSNNIALLKAIALISGQFDDSRTVLSFDYKMEWGVVGLEWQQNVAIENIERYEVVLVNLFITLSPEWSAQGRLGSPSGGSINTEGFGSLALTYSW